MVERQIRDRIKELRRVRASELVPNPKNWRRHPKEQAAALRGLLSEIGYADALLARELDDGRLMLIDGHLRAETTKKATVPVLVLDVTEEEADKLLLTLDPLAAMALADQAGVAALLETVRTDSQAVAELLERVAGQEAWQAVNGSREVIDPPIEKDKLTAGETGFLFKAALIVAKRWAIAGASLYATVPSGPLLVYFIQALTAAGFTFRAQLIWVKQQFVIGMADYHHRYEPILYGWLPDGAHYFIEDRRQDDVFEVDKPHASDLHPTTKPVELIARMIRNSSREGELVYDPFSGSGSTVLAAHQLKRIGYGVEIDPGYVAVALERLSMLGLEPVVTSP